MALPSYLEDTAKDYAKQSVATYSAPIETSTFTGGLDAQGKRASGAMITGANPYVAAMDPLQTQAMNLATAGVGSYAPYLQAAQTNITNQAGLTGPSAYSSFMSPYQQQVIDTSLADFDSSRVGNRQAIQDQAVASGNFGGGREGAMLGQYDADTTQGRAALLAQLQQGGYNQATQLAQQAFANQAQLGQNQFGLAGFERGSMGQDISALGIIVYPNPTTDIITIETRLKIEVEVYDIMGKLLINKDSKRIDLSEYPNGVYNLILIYNNKRFNTKVIKQ